MSVAFEATHSLTMHDRNSPIDSDTADNRSESDALSDNCVRFWLWVLRNYRNYGADERVQTMLARLCLSLRLVLFKNVLFVFFLGYVMIGIFVSLIKQQEKK